MVMNGSFNNGEKVIDYRIIDPPDGGVRYTKGEEKWKRFIYFYHEGKVIGFMPIYGDVEEMSTISIDYVLKKFEEHNERGEINFNLTNS